MAHLNTEGFAQPRRNVEYFGIQPDMLVADLGAGSGEYTHAIAELLAGSGRVYAVDVQRDLLKRIKNESVRRGGTPIDVLWGDIENHGGSKLADGMTDRVLMSNVLFQLDQKRAALREAHRILKLDGRLIVIDWLGSFGGVGPHRDHVVPKEDVLMHAREVGFDLDDTFTAGAHHYGLIFKHMKHIAEL